MRGLIESLRFYEYQRHIFLLHFEIEALEYRITNPFKTDMYINLLQWEELYGKINEILREVMKLSNWKIGKLKGKIRVTELTVEYHLFDKTESLLNFDKFPYELEWFMKIKILRNAPKENCHDSDTDKGLFVESRDKFFKKQKICDNNEASCSSTGIMKLYETKNEENALEFMKALDRTDLSSDGDIGDEYLHQQRNRKRKKIKKESSFEDIFKKIPPKTRLTMAKKPNQSNLNNWVTSNSMKCDERTRNYSNSHTKREKIKGTKEKDTISMGLKTGDTVVVDLIDDKKRQQMENFLEKSKKDQIQKDIRKKELASYKIVDCKHLKEEDIMNMMQSMKKFIYEKYIDVLNGERTLIIDGSEIPSFIITTSNIFYESQNLLILKQIEKICNSFTNRLSNEDDFIHDIIFPATLIEIFKKAYDLTTSQAINQIKTQEEYFTYYNKSDTSL